MQFWGTQSLHTNSKDEALALPSEESVTIALRTQQVIAHEIGVTDTVDPLGGSYYLEHLTDTIEAKVWEYLDRIEKMGGRFGPSKRDICRKKSKPALIDIKKPSNQEKKS